MSKRSFFDYSCPFSRLERTDRDLNDRLLGNPKLERDHVPILFDDLGLPSRIQI